MRLRWSDRSDGDFHRTEVALTELDARRRAVVDLPWTMLDEHHGTTVVGVDRPGDADGAPGDILVTAAHGAVLGCWVGDCAPLVLIGRDDAIAVVHAGWRGLASGVIDVAVAAFGEPVTHAFLGPCIGPCCYEFGAHDLDEVAAGVHAEAETVTGRTSGGRRALDVPAAVGSALARYGLVARKLAGCTGCTFEGFSHRVRAERERHVVAAWIDRSSGEWS